MLTEEKGRGTTSAMTQGFKSTGGKKQNGKHVIRKRQSILGGGSAKWLGAESAGLLWEAQRTL